MAKHEVTLPALGEGIIEATIIRWLKSEGEKIDQEDSIVEIATDKVDSEVPSPVKGILHKVLFSEGEIPKVGDVIAIIETEGDEKPNDEKENKLNNNKKEEIINFSSKPNKNDIESHIIKSRTSSGKFLSPLVRKIAEKEKLSMKILDSINGSGLEGRITKDDVIQHINSEKTQQTSVLKDVERSFELVENGVNQTISENTEIVEMNRVRKLIANHMVRSKQISPHVTSFHEVDVTRVVEWRKKIKDDFQKREGEKLTYTPIFIEAIVKTIKDLPNINVSVDGTRILLKKNINIGMATSLPNGNLIVPVIKIADQQNLSGLTRSVNDLANRARNNKLLPNEIQGGTFTVTNLGAFGNLSGTPIINQPEVAILALGAIKKRVVVIETDKGDNIGIRHIMIISLSYDHRVVDGALGGMFLKKVSDYLEKFDINRKS